MSNLVTTISSGISAIAHLPLVTATTALVLAHPALTAIALVGLLFLSIGLYLLHRHNAQHIKPHQTPHNEGVSKPPPTTLPHALPPPQDKEQPRVEETAAKVDAAAPKAPPPTPIDPIAQKRGQVRAQLASLADTTNPSAVVAKTLLQNVLTQPVPYSPYIYAAREARCEDLRGAKVRSNLGDEKSSADCLSQQVDMENRGQVGLLERDLDFVTSPLFAQFCEAAKQAPPLPVASPEKNMEEFKARLCTFLNGNAKWLSQKDIEQLVTLVNEEYNTPSPALPFEQGFCEFIVRQSMLGDARNLNDKKLQILRELASNNTPLGLALKYMLENDCPITDGKLEDAEFLELAHKLAQAALEDRAGGASRIDEEKQKALATVVKGLLEHCQKVGALVVLTQNDFVTLRNVLETDPSVFPKAVSDHLKMVVQKAFETAAAKVLTDKEKELFKDLRSKASFKNLDNDPLFPKAWFHIWSTESAIVRYRKAIKQTACMAQNKITFLETDLANRTKACTESVQELFNGQKVRLEKMLKEKIQSAQDLLQSFDATTISGAIANDILRSAINSLEKLQASCCDCAKAVDGVWNSLKTLDELQWLTNPLFIRFCTAISKTPITSPKTPPSLKETKEQLEYLFKLCKDAEISLVDEDFQQLVTSINNGQDFSADFQNIIQNKSAATRQALYNWTSGASCDITKFTPTLAAAFQDLQKIAEDNNAKVDLNRLNLLGNFLVSHVLTFFRKDSPEFKQIKDIVKSKQYQNAVKNIQHQLTEQHLDLIENKMQSLNAGEDETLLWGIADNSQNPIQENFHTLQVCAEKADVVQAIVAKTVETKPSKKLKYGCDTQNQNLLTFSKFSSSLPKVVSIIHNLTDPKKESVKALQTHAFISFIKQQFNAFQDFVLVLPYAIGYLPKATALINEKDNYSKKTKTGQITTPVIQEFYSEGRQTVLPPKQGGRLEPDNFLIGPTQISCRFALLGSEMQKQMHEARVRSLLPIPTDKKQNEFTLSSFNAYVEVAEDFAATVNSLKVWLESTTIRSAAHN